MEIPVRFVKVLKKVEQEEKKQWVNRSRNNSFSLEEEMQKEKFETKKEFTTTYGSNPKLNKNWVHLIELEKETEMFRQPLHTFLNFNNVLERVHVQINPMERVLLLKIRETPFSRFISVPHFVNLDSVKVKYCVEKKVVLIKAPHMPSYYTNPMKEVMTIDEQEQMRLWPRNKRTLVNIPVLMMKETCECKEKCTFTSIKPSTENTYTSEMPIFKEQLFRRTIQLEKQVFEQCLTQHRQMKEVIITKVCPILRVVIVKLRQNVNNTIVPFKRIIRVPSSVNMEHIKVELCQERRAILIKAAPFQQKDFFNTLSQLEMFNRRSEWEMLEKEPEYELSMYKMLKQLRRQCPLNTVILPRFIRSRKTGEQVLHLDVECTRFNPEHLLVKTKKEFTKKVTIRHQYRDTDFLHKFTLPTECDVDRMRTSIVNKRTLRIKLPFTPRTPIRMF